MSSNRVIKAIRPFRHMPAVKDSARPRRIIPSEIARQKQRLAVSDELPRHVEAARFPIPQRPGPCDRCPSSARAKHEKTSVNQALIDGLIHEKMREAEAKCLKEKQVAYSAGFDEGTVAGLREGRENARANGILLENIAAELCSWKEKFLQDAEAGIARLSVDIAESIIGQAAMNCSREALEHNLKRCLETLKGSGNVRIRINPADYEFVMNNVNILQRNSKSQFAFDFEPDPSILPGGCHLETPFGAVDGRLESQFDLLKKSLLQLV